MSVATIPSKHAHNKRGHGTPTPQLRTITPQFCHYSDTSLAYNLETDRFSSRPSGYVAMNITVFAMRRPITVVMIIVALIGGGILALNRMRIDIFPAINAPQIYVVNNYAGMDPSQIEGIVTNVYEQNFQYVDGLKGVESKNIQNFVQLKLTFYPGTDMAAAMSQVVSLTNRAAGRCRPACCRPS